MSGSEKAVSQVFSIGATLDESWRVFKQNWTKILLLFLSISAVSFILTIIGGEADSALYLISNLAIIAFSLLIGPGIISFGLLLFRDPEKAQLGELVRRSDVLAQFVLGSIVFGILVWVGTIFFIIPGIIFATMYMFMPFIIVDKKVSFTQAMEMSKKMTEGVRLKLFLFMIAASFVGMVGVFALVVGLLVTYPVAALMYVAAYEQLKDRA